jgi:hypothetical protein
LGIAVGEQLTQPFAGCGLSGGKVVVPEQSEELK